MLTLCFDYCIITSIFNRLEYLRLIKINEQVEQERKDMENTNQYLTEKEVSNYTRIALSTLRNQRSLNYGIPYVKIGKSVRYCLKDIQEYMQFHTIQVNKN